MAFGFPVLSSMVFQLPTGVSRSAPVAHAAAAINRAAPAATTLRMASIYHDGGTFATGIGIRDFRTNGALLAGHQGDVIIAIDGRQNTIAGLLAHGLDADHQGGRASRITQSRGKQPGGALAGHAGSGFELY